MPQEPEIQYEPRNWGGKRQGAGRKPLIPNDYTREIREAMFAAAENSEYGKDPSNPNAPGNLTRFFTTLANNNIGVFCMLFGKMIPRQIHTQSEGTVEVTYQSVDDVKRALEAAGMPLKLIEQLAAMLPVDDVIDIEAEEVSHEP